jgi:O-antigen ligase
MIIKKNSYHSLLLIASILLILIPPALVSGPFLPDLFIVLISIIFLFIYGNSKKIFLNNLLFLKLFLIFFIYLNFISIISENVSQSLKPSITYIRFGIFSLAIFFILEKREDFKKYFYFVLCLTLVIVIFDGYFQFFIGNNIFGYEVNRPDRLGGLFFDELILGSYLGKILPVFCTFSLFNREYLNKYHIITFILLIYLLIFLSGERSAFLTTSLYLVLIAPFFVSFKKGIFFFISIVILFGGIIASNKNIKSRYFDQMIAHTIPNKVQHGKDYFLPEHIGLFKNAIIIFKQNILFGGGVKTFRINCNYVDEKKIDPEKFKLSDVINTDDCKIYLHSKNCSTHPHNYYLQLLAETGLFGFIFVFAIFLKLLLNYFKQIYYLLRNKNKINISNNLILCGLISYIWPIITTGSFFNNWICSILFLQIGIYLYTLNYLKNK